VGEFVLQDRLKHKVVVSVEEVSLGLAHLPAVGKVGVVARAVPKRKINLAETVVHKQGHVVIQQDVTGVRGAHVHVQQIRILKLVAVVVMELKPELVVPLLRAHGVPGELAQGIMTVRLHRRPRFYLHLMIAGIMRLRSLPSVGLPVQIIAV